MKGPRSRFVCLLACAAAAALQQAAGASGDVILRAVEATVVQGTWQVVADASAAGGARLWNPDASAPKPATALASPASYFELTFAADAGVPYHLWLRGRAERDSYENDSVYVQFSDSVTAAGEAVWRIGTSSGTSVVLEDCPGCGVSGWGWQDNHYGGLANPIYFAVSGTHTLRIQVREDGLSIDQIVLSPGTWLTTPPGAPREDATILSGSTPPSPPPAGSLVRGPYLHQVTDRSAVIVWASREPGPASATVGSRSYAATSSFYGASATGIPDYFQHEAVVTGLAASTTYPYQLFVGEAAVTSGGDQLRTAPPSGTGSIRFIIFGDSGTGSAEQRALASQMNADDFDLALHGGDIVYGSADGTGGASHSTFQSWFFDMYAAWLRRQPIFPSMGNHDAREANGWGQAYLDLFALPDEAGAGGWPDHAERYYSFDYGPTHFVALDTERAFADEARRAAQVAWLEADLAAATAQPWKVVFYHRSPFSSGAGHGSDLSVRQVFAPIFERYGVQLSLSAHEHGYERSVPWRTTETASQAVTYVVSGGGGAPLYPAGRDGWTAVSASEHHYVRITIEGCVATIEAVGAGGSTIDAGTLDRCAQAADVTPPVVGFTELASGMSVSGITSVAAEASDDVRVEKVDLLVDGRLHGSDRTGPYAFSWDAAAEAPGPHTLELRAYDMAGRRTATSIVLNVVDSGGGSEGLPAGWSADDIGNVGVTGATQSSGGVFAVDGAGADIWGTTDGFRFTYQRLSGDGDVIARVASLQGSDPWAKAGVMVRASTNPGAAHAFMLVSLARGLAYQRRTATGGVTTHTAGPAAGAPSWVRLVRTGHIFTAYASMDGRSWSMVGSDVVVMPADVLVGLAVTSHTTATLASATFDGLIVSAPRSLPAPWTAGDVGDVGVSGSASGDGGTFAVTGAGADVWGTLDAFHFVWQPLEGDGAIVARLASLTSAHDWTKAGVMLRASFDPSSAHAFMLVSATKGLAFQRRTSAGIATTHTGAGDGDARWLRLVRQGSLIVASLSHDGATWVEAGRDTLSLPATAYVGLAVTSHDGSRLATGTFDNVAISK